MAETTNLKICIPAWKVETRKRKC